MKTGVLILLDTLDIGGAESLAVNIALEIKHRGNYHPIICLTRKGGMLEEKLHENGIKYYVLGRHNRYEIHKFYGLRKIIKSENIKLIHGHKPGSNFWAGIFGKMFGIPVVSHLHTHPEELGRVGGTLITKFISATSDRIISISENVRESLIEKENVDPSKIVTIRNGIRYMDYVRKPNKPLLAELGVSADSKVIAIVARLRQEKNHMMLLRAAKQLLDQNLNFTFLFVGEGVLREQLEKEAFDMGILERCIFTGLRQDIPDILSIIDLGVLCSHYEGIPLVVLEYMAASKPVISTDIKGVHEIIENGRNGLLVPLGNPGALAEAIVRITQDKSLAKSLAVSGFKTVSENFSEDSMMNKIESLYEQVLEDQ